MAWLSGWQYRKKLTIDKTKVDADLTDFPVLVKLTSSNFNFSRARSDGYDIRFTSSDGTTLLKYERERHDSSNQVAEYHVKIPFVSSSSNTDFYIYYGNPSASDGADPTNVWDSNFKGVWHLKDYTTSQVNDSTINANNGTKTASNEPLEVDAKIGKGQQFDGINDMINCGSNSVLMPQAITLSLWFKPNYIGTPTKGLLHICPDDGSAGAAIMYDSDVAGIIKFFVKLGGSWYNASSTIYMSVGNWYHIVCTFGDGYQKLYINGSINVSISRSGTINYGTSPYCKIGRGNSTEWSYGVIDEVSISNVVRSAAWIKASYNSGNDTLLSYGSEELPSPFLLFFN